MSEELSGSFDMDVFSDSKRKRTQADPQVAALPIAKAKTILEYKRPKVDFAVDSDSSKIIEVDSASSI